MLSCISAEEQIGLVYAATREAVSGILGPERSLAMRDELKVGALMIFSNSILCRNQSVGCRII